MAEIRLTFEGGHPPCLAYNLTRVMHGDPDAVDRTCVKSVGADAVRVHCPHKIFGPGAGGCDVTMTFTAPGYIPARFDVKPDDAAEIINQCPWKEEWQDPRTSSAN